MMSQTGCDGVVIGRGCLGRPWLFADLAAAFDTTAPFPVEILGQPRGRTNSPGRVTLPDGWLNDRDSDLIPEDAEPACASRPVETQARSPAGL